MHMKEERKQELARLAADFRLPRYEQIPNVGLYLEQATKFLSEYLAPLGELTLTPSMISNYVKRGLIASPVKKQYDREQIAHLMFIALAKSILSLDELQQFIALQRRTYATGRAYDYFCMEFENILQYVFGAKERTENIGVDFSDEKTILRNAIIAMTHKIYLEKYLQAMSEN